MDDSKNGEKKRYNTSELLSLNMDRLKEYMKRLAKEAGNPDGMPAFEISPAKPRPTTRIVKRPHDCRCLAMFKDPFHFVQIVSVNDRRPAGQQYPFERTSSFRDAVDRMSKQKYEAVVVSPMIEPTGEEGITFSTSDLILLLRGLTRPSDVYFLAKKRWFVMNAFPGAQNPEKVDGFHELRDLYQKVPFIFVPDDPADPEAAFLAAAPKVKICQRTPAGLDGLFRLLDEITMNVRS
ncbi:MAG: hypothetical protein MUC63_00360 [Planctomycetes bacterium]|jgi:hypothetical protein|nr:hypothetical protein [Planctomycetota bacterium]